MLSTEKEVTKLRAELEQMQPLLEEAVQEAVTTMETISVDSKVAAETRATVQKEEEEAIKKAKAEKPDVIFLDIVMPEMDGFATCRALHEDPETKDIPVIFVSSKNQKADKVWAQMQGAKDLIGKQGDAKEILAALAAL